MQLKPEHLTEHGKKLWAAHEQKGGSWSGFVNWVKGAAKTVWNKAIKPAARFIKDNGIISKIADKIDPRAGTVARAVGLGRKKKSQKGGTLAWSGIDKARRAGQINFPKKPILGAGAKKVVFG